MKRIVSIIIILCLGASAYEAIAAETDKIDGPGKSEKSAAQPRIAVKLNAITLIGIINPAVEFKVHDHWTTQLETIGCFFNDGFLFLKAPTILSNTFLETRWYPKEAYRGFFAGLHVGYGVWRLTKGDHPMYEGSYKNSYQSGHNLMCGLTAGYMFSFSHHWGMELSIGAGYQLAKYIGYEKGTDLPYMHYNASAEWLPYKGAISVVYKW